MSKSSVKYSEALAEIEAIIEKIETRELDVDELSGNLKKVSSLIKICRDKLRETEQEVQKILDTIKD